MSKTEKDRYRSPYLCEVAARLERLSSSLWGDDRAIDLTGRHPCFVELLSQVEKIASFNEPVLIVGESGVGKEYLAQAIYLLSPRLSRPFVTVSCPQYQEGNLTVSELFGHVRGSFTGAVRDRQGCFETADGGVIFLDEIADLHQSAQVLLLRALANGDFRPLGSDRTHTVNVRVVAATNRPLRQLMTSEAFRRDLFFRIGYFQLDVPALRRRGDDWLLLSETFLERLHRRYGVAKRFSAASLSLLAGYDWPGNVRQLLSVTTTGYAMSDTDTIEPRDFVSQLDTAAVDAGGDALAGVLDGLVSGAGSFWEVVHRPFMERDLRRKDVRRLIRRGLLQASGSYRELLESWHLPAAEYQRFMDFLRHHRLKP